ncbi:MAG TPA: HD domain-containing protein [Oscillospiraceae bacterium]|nr:HD domain-containing protein [Oscillospiraceae bacterium]HXK77699.1 HD domain-containing protein [Oscillospiraceae bacterium]
MPQRPEDYDFALLNRALLFAAEKHSGVFRKATGMPYIFHPMEAAAVAATVTNDPEVLAAALLHDVVEDAGVTEEELRLNFGERVAALVAEESENKRENMPAELTWKIRKQEAVTHLASAERDAKIVALGDKLSNMRAVARDYETFGPDLWRSFHCRDPEEQAWYYRSMTRALSELSATPAWREFAELVERVFGPEPED